MRSMPAKKFITTAAIFALIIAAIIAAYGWMYQRVSVLVLELGQLDTKIASRHKEQEQTSLLATLFRNHHADFDRLRTLEVSQANPAPFFQEFEMLAARTHTTITIDLSSAQPEGAADQSIAFRFTIEGTEANAAAMLAFIEHAPYEITIDGIQIQKSSEQEGARISISASKTGVQQATRVHLIVDLHVRAL